MAAGNKLFMKSLIMRFNVRNPSRERLVLQDVFPGWNAGILWLSVRQS